MIVAVFFEELPDGKVRVSMRSKNEKVDVCAICQKFGGGGHECAGGFSTEGPIDQAAKRVLAELRAKVGI